MVGGQVGGTVHVYLCETFCNMTEPPCFGALHACSRSTGLVEHSF